MQYRSVLLNIMEMNLRDLASATAELSRGSKEWYYARGLELFLTNQLDGLENHLLENSSICSELTLLLKIRWAIRSASIDDSMKSNCLKMAERGDELSGEAYFVLAMAEESLSNEQMAWHYWNLCQRQLEIFGLKKKALKALHNRLATESRIEPSKRLIPEYRELILKCEALNEKVVLANAELNISREFQLIGALNVALRHAERAVALTSEFQPGGLQYFLSIAHRCHLFIELEKISIAAVDFEELQTALFPEAIAIAKVLELQLNKQLYVKMQVHGEADITASWAERYENILAKVPAGAKVTYTTLEQKIIDALTDGPKTRFELIELLFDNIGDVFALENRLKQILFRIRKKAPGLIELRDQRYMFTEKDLPQVASK